MYKKDISTLSNCILNNLNHELFEGDIKPYFQNYIFTVVENLKLKYANTLKLVGDQNFKFFAKNYAQSYKSKSPNIDYYGKEFGSFLLKREELKDIPYIEHFANLDWLYFNEDETQVLSIYDGVLEFWLSFYSGIQLEQVEIDLEVTVEIDYLKLIELMK